MLETDAFDRELTENREYLEAREERCVAFKDDGHTEPLKLCLCYKETHNQCKICEFSVRSQPG